jgi:hypothetical protein
MGETAEQILKQAELYTDDQDYTFITLPAGAITAAAGVVAEVGEPFCALLVDKDEVSLMIPQEAWNDFQKRLPGAQVNPTPYRVITFDTPLQADLVGFMALVSTALANAQISILPFAAFSRDHLFVPADQLQTAIAALEELKA